MHTLILGLGNPIMGDDGVGWRVAERLKSRPLTPGVEVDQLAGGGIGLMERLIGYQRAVIVDAIYTGKFSTGSVHVFGLEELENSFAGHLGSAHETNLRTALDLGRRLGAVLPDQVTIVAIESQYVYEFSEELSPAVAASVEEAIRVLLELL